MVEYMTLDIETKSKILLSKLPLTFTLFVDPWSNRHAVPCGSGETSSCFSRKDDMVSLVKVVAIQASDITANQENSRNIYPDSGTKIVQTTQHGNKHSMDL